MYQRVWLSTATWRFSSSRRRWSSKIWRSGRIVLVKVCGYFALVNWSLDQLLGKRKRTKHCLNPHSSEHFMFFWAIQGHSGGTLVDPSSQDSVLSPNDFADYIYHIGKNHNGTPPSRVDWFREEEVSKRTSSPCFPQQWTRCTPIKIWKKFNTIWISPGSRCTKTIGEFTKIEYWFKLKLAQRKGLQFYQTRFNAITLFNTLHAVCIEQVAHMKTGEE